MNKKNDTDDKEVDITNVDKANFYMWGKYGTQSCIVDKYRTLNEYLLNMIHYPLNSRQNFFGFKQL